METNTKRFIKKPKKYFSGSYKRSIKFGGPSNYFHRECLKAGKVRFLSNRHIEMLYATLTAWGMHRMGDFRNTKTKLTEWKDFRKSFVKNANQLQKFRGYNMLTLSETKYSERVQELEPIYKSLKLSKSKATIVVNSKAFYHLFPNFIPPIDRQYTIRFFRQHSKKWRNKKGKFSAIQLPSKVKDQFRLFYKTCIDMKKLSNGIDKKYFNRERKKHNVTAPKALDNAIINYVTIIAKRNN